MNSSRLSMFFYEVATVWACNGTQARVDEPVAAVAPVTETHFTLENGTFIKHPPPLPDEIPVSKVVHSSDGTKEALVGYRMWDFNHDGRADLIETLNGAGQTERFEYDFNFDGQIDYYRIGP